jgi:hypothetical protein
MSPRISSIKAETCRRKTLIDSAFFVRTSGSSNTSLTRSADDARRGVGVLSTIYPTASGRFRAAERGCLVVRTAIVHERLSPSAWSKRSVE